MKCPRRGESMRPSSGQPRRCTRANEARKMSSTRWISPCRGSQRNFAGGSALGRPPLTGRRWLGDRLPDPRLYGARVVRRSDLSCQRSRRGRREAKPVQNHSEEVGSAAGDHIAEQKIVRLSGIALRRLSLLREPTPPLFVFLGPGPGHLDAIGFALANP